ncbi:hypothetical protein [Gloeothece citriformis]|nr:hypothetical protein [Gloeothece citriformis]
MFKLLEQVTLVVTGVALLFQGLLVKTVSAQTPSLGNGIMCVAKGTTKDGKIYPGLKVGEADLSYFSLFNY